MESAVKKSVHIEFYGMPGCGKSTVSHMVANLLRKEGLRVYEPTYVRDHMIKPFQRKGSKIRILFKYMTLHPKLIKFLNKIIKRNGYFTLRERVRQMINILPKMESYVVSKNKKGIYLWDEGIVQSAISLTINGSIHAQKNYNELRKILPKDLKIIKIYLVSDIETVLDRIKLRKSNDSRIEKEGDPQKRMEMINRFMDACNQVINKNPDFIIESNVKNAERIATFIRKLMKEI